MSSYSAAQVRTYITAGVVLVMTVAFALGAVFNAASGSFADWLAAVSTLAAFAAAAFAAVQATGVYRMESARDEQRRQTERRSQASLFTVWPGSIRFLDAELDEQTGVVEAIGIEHVQAWVKNASTVPVSSAIVDVNLTAVTPDGRYRKGPETAHWIGLIPPSDGAPDLILVPIHEPITDETAPPCDQWTWDIALSVRFVDAAGVIWRRNHLGALEEEDSPLPAGELQDPVN